MIGKFKKFSFGMMTVCLLLATSGCIPLLIGAAAGVGSIAYVKGALVQNIDEPVENLSDRRIKPNCGVDQITISSAMRDK